MKPEYYIVDGVCIDCLDPESKSVCFNLLNLNHYVEVDYKVHVTLEFNREF